MTQGQVLLLRRGVRHCKLEGSAKGGEALDLVLAGGSWTRPQTSVESEERAIWALEGEWQVSSASKREVARARPWIDRGPRNFEGERSPVARLLTRGRVFAGSFVKRSTRQAALVNKPMICPWVGQDEDLHALQEDNNGCNKHQRDPGVARGPVAASARSRMIESTACRIA